MRLENNNLFLKSFFFPLWVWFLGFMAWFSAEIVTVSTVFDKIDFGTLIFSFSYYLIQMAIVADIILRKQLSLWGIFLLGLMFGVLEEAFYIKNPLFLTLLLALGHATVTVLFPYLLVNFLIPVEKKPFLPKRGYLLAGAYLLVLYLFMVGFIPFLYLDSLFLSLFLLLVLVLLLIKFGKGVGEKGAGPGLKKLEKIGIFAGAGLIIALSQQPYLGIMLILIWLLIRQKILSRGDLYLLTVYFLIFHFLGAVLNKSVEPSKMAVNYPLSLIIGLILLFWLWRRRAERVRSTWLG